MLSKPQFTTKSAEEQLQILQEIFSQLTSPQWEVSNITFLLQSGFPFSSETLVAIYTLLYTTVEEGERDQQSTNLIAFKKIHQMLEEEASTSIKEADDLLDTIE